MERLENAAKELTKSYPKKISFMELQSFLSDYVLLKKRAIRTGLIMSAFLSDYSLKKKLLALIDAVKEQLMIEIKKNELIISELKY
ncbi:MAG: hypothetical protein ACFFD4_35385 [Candidatus Odinarchaeota archaeon]